MQKRYWLKAGIIGLVIGIGVSIYFLSQSACIGLFLNSDGTMGSVCPTEWADIFLKNVQGTPLYAHIIPLAIFFIAGAFAGWLFGKIKSRSIHNS